MAHDKEKIIAQTVMRRLLDNDAVTNIRRSALELFEKYVAEYANELAKKTIYFMKHAGRKTITIDDIKGAAEMMKN